MAEKFDIYSSVVIIPSLDPEEGLIEYVNKLIEAGFHKIIIFNDFFANSKRCDLSALLSFLDNRVGVDT